MNNERNHRHGTEPPMEDYEARYRSLGHLFYSIAACDRRIVQREIDALKRMTAEHWLVEDRSYDELGVESARHIDITFDRLVHERMSYAAAYARFEADQLREPDRFDVWTRSLILRTAVAIAQASGSVNGSEARRIGALQELFAKSA